MRMLHAALLALTLSVAGCGGGSSTSTPVTPPPSGNTYKPGEFLDARNPESAIRNEFLWIGFEDAEPHAGE